MLRQLFVLHKITERFVHVHRERLVIHLRIVSKMFRHHLNVHQIQIAHCQWHVLINDAEIHAMNEIHVLKMQNVVFHNIVRCASVHWDGAAIHNLNATNVRKFGYFVFLFHRTD